MVLTMLLYEGHVCKNRLHQTSLLSLCDTSKIIHYNHNTMIEILCYAFHKKKMIMRQKEVSICANSMSNTRQCPIYL